VGSNPGSALQAHRARGKFSGSRQLGTSFVCDLKGLSERRSVSIIVISC